jgi:hypothetical protein
LLFPVVPITMNSSIPSPCYVLSSVLLPLLSPDNAQFKRDHVSSIPRLSRTRPPIYPLTFTHVTIDGLRMCITTAWPNFMKYSAYLCIFCLSQLLPF